MTLRTILVGVDREGRALDAVRLGVAMAGSTGAALHLLHVVELTRRFWPYAEPLPQEDAERLGEQVFAQLRGELPPSSVEAHLRLARGHPVREIMSTAEDLEADLLILGRHHRGLMDPLIGGTASRVLRCCPCPVLVHKTGVTEFRNVLVGADRSEESGRALSWAVDWARVTKGMVTALYVFEPPDFAYSPAGVAIPTYVVDGARREEYEAFDREMLAFDWGGVPHQFLKLEGEPGTLVVERAQALGCDLAVIGTRGRTGLARLLLGSVAEHVIRRSTQSVLVVP